MTWQPFSANKKKLVDTFIVGERLKQSLWAAALLGIGMLFALPIRVLMEAQFYMGGSVMKGNFSNGNVPLQILIIAFGLFLGWNYFSYLQSSQRVDYYHSLPITRKDLFVANYLAANISFIVAYTINLALALLIYRLSISPIVTWKMIVSSYLINTVGFNLFFLLGSFSVMMTGTKVTAVMMNLCLLEGVQLLAIATNEFMRQNLLTFDGASREWQDFILYASPISAIFSPWSSGYLLAVLLLSIGLFFLTMKLYETRQLEMVGTAVRGRVFPQVVKYIILLGFSLAGGLVFKSIGNQSVGWMFFGILLVGFLGHLIAEGVYHLDLHRIFANYQGMILFLTGLAAVVLMVEGGLFGYDSKYSPPEKVASYEILFPNVRVFPFIENRGITIQSEEGKQLVNQLVQKGIEVAENKNASGDYYVNYHSSDKAIIRVNLKSGGGYKRAYKDISSVDFEPMLKKLLESEELKAYEQKVFDEIKEVEFMEIGTFGENDGYRSIRSRQNQQRILKAIRQDLLQRAPRDRGNDIPLARITMGILLGDAMESSHQAIFIYKDDQHVLKELGKRKFQFNTLRPEDVRVVVLSSAEEVDDAGRYIGDTKFMSRLFYGTKEYYATSPEEGGRVIITNKEDIAKILEDYPPIDWDMGLNGRVRDYQKSAEITLNSGEVYTREKRLLIQ